MARKKAKSKPVKVKKVKKISPRKAKKIEDKRYEALRTKQNEEAKRTGNAVPYDQRDKATWRKSTDPQATYIRTNRPEQQQVKEHMRSRLNPAYDALRLPGDKSTFDPIEQRTRENFANKTVPGLAQRFQHATGGAGYGSGVFAKQLASAHSDMESELNDARARHSLDENRLESQNYFNALGAYQEPDIDTGFTPGQDSTLRKGAKFVAQQAGNFVGAQGGDLLQRGYQAFSNRKQNKYREPANSYTDFNSYDALR